MKKNKFLIMYYVSVEIKKIVLYMVIELLLGIFFALYIWLKNLYLILNYPNCYKIVKVNIDKNSPDYYQYQQQNNFGNFLGTNYTCAIIKYKENKILCKTFYTLLASSVQVKYDQQEESLRKSSPIYNFTVNLPIFITL